jgi:hypothetical protein
VFSLPSLNSSALHRQFLVRFAGGELGSGVSVVGRVSAV